MALNDFGVGRNRIEREEKAIVGLGCLFVLAYIAWIMLVVWAIVRLVLHFT